MSDMSTLANPFLMWAELARGLRDRFLEELGDPRPVSATTDDVLNELAVIIARCDHLGTSLHRLQQTNGPAWDAFLRALEKS